MHISLSIITERLSRHEGLGIDVVASEHRRGIASLSLPVQAPRENVLVVAGAQESETLASARHLLVVASPDEEVSLPGCPDLAVVRTSLSPGDVYAQACSEFIALSNWDSRMLEAIASHQPLNAILQIAAEQLANPLALFDSKQALLAYAGALTKAAVGTIWEDVLEKRFTPMEYFTRAEQALLASHARATWPFLLQPARDPRHTQLSLQIRVGGQTIGSIGQVDINAPFTEGEQALASLVGERLQLALAQRLSGDAGNDDTSYLLRSILNGNKADRGLVAYHTARLGWRNGEELCLVVAALPDEPAESPGNAARLQELARSVSESAALIYDDHALILAPARRIDAGALAKVLSSLELRGVRSEPMVEISKLRCAYDQCLLALETLGQAPESPLVPFSSRFEQVIVSVILREQGPDTLCDPSVLALAREGLHGDRERGLMLVRELYAFLINGCNALVTARQLYVHRNTLTYHIEQVEKALGRQVARLSGAERLMLMVSCLVALGAHEERDGLATGRKDRGRKAIPS